MVLSKIWSQGQLFAFSALDGVSNCSNDFVGILSADRIGIRFFSKTKRELFLAPKCKCDYTYEAVLSDLIDISVENKKSIKIIYADTHLIIGKTNDIFLPIVTVEGSNNTYKISDIEIQDSLDGDFTGIKFCNSTFCFAYGNSEKEVIDLINKGFTLNIEAEYEKKIKLYNKYSLSETNKYAALYSKCLSTMKTQLYSPEGKFGYIWSTPDRLPHKACWLWDSVFHAIGHSNYNKTVAEELILSIFDFQSEDGFISHMSTLKWQSAITQPPVIAWGANIVYSRTKNLAFLRKVYNCNKKFLNWCKDNRRDTTEELYTWFTGDDVNCRCDESGMDNSPRFDKHTRLQAIDYSCFMANDVRNMAIIATELELYDEAKMYNNWFEEIKYCINNKLWDSEDEFYYDFDLNDNSLHKISSVASFLPLFAGVCDNEKAKALHSHLLNKDEYYTEFPIPSISKKDATFGSDMWRGPVWINYNYMIAKGLTEYGFSELAEEIIEKTIKYMNEWYLKKGTLFEFYDSENKNAPCELNRKGKPIEPYNFEVKMQTIREYGWSNTLLFDILHNKYFF